MTNELLRSAGTVFRDMRRTATDRLFPRFFAALDHRLGTRSIAPLNHQSGRTAIFNAILGQCGIMQVVETGTYRGSTTQWLAGFGLPVYTVEANPRFAHLARLRFADNPLVHPVEMDSAEFLKRLAGDPDRTRQVTFFYLDAHWGERLPLAEEITIVCRAFPRAIVAIDDFEVPDDPDYGFDDYGPGKRLNLEYVKQAGVPGLGAFFPALAGAQEDGARRGCVVLTGAADLAECLARIPQLRAYPV